jgi:hypothetical protein
VFKGGMFEGWIALLGKHFWIDGTLIVGMITIFILVGKEITSAKFFITMITAPEHCFLFLLGVIKRLLPEEVSSIYRFCLL